MHRCFFISVCIFVSLSFVYAEESSTPPAGSLDFCLPFDYTKWRDSLVPSPSTKLTSQQAIEYVVRVVHFIPNDRVPSENREMQLDELVKHSQRFFADEMERHGYGRKTFRLEKDSSGSTIIHKVTGKYSQDYYGRDTHKAIDEVAELSNLNLRNDNNIYVVFTDFVDNQGFSQVGGYGGGDSHSGVAVVTLWNYDVAPNGLYLRAWTTVAHELGHAFGLPHDFRSDSYMMSYGDHNLANRLSECSSRWLNVHRYFNSDSIDRGNAPVDIKLDQIILDSPPDNIKLRFSLVDSDGLHHLLLLADSERNYLHKGETIISCKTLQGEESFVEFFTNDLTANHRFLLVKSIDVLGNFSTVSFSFDIRSLRPPTSPAVTIPDKNLDQSIRETLGILVDNPITELDMLDLVFIDASDKGITNLSGIEYATNLEILRLNNNGISDLAPLSNLTKIKNLQLIRNNINDLSPLSTLTKLSSLWAWDNNINDLSPLSTLTNMTALLLGGNRITDISPLEKLTNIRRLQLQSNRVRDISVIAQMTRLTGLSLKYNRIVDISPLVGLFYFKQLHLVGNHIENAYLLNETVANNPNIDIDITIPPEPPSEPPSEPSHPADFNWDGLVDLADFLLFVDHFGASSGDSLYEARFDLDRDGMIGIGDFLIFVEDFGKSGS